jgi:hypothetical protein
MDGTLEGVGKGLEEIGALLVQRGEIGTDDAEGLETSHRAKAARDFLFYLGHSHCLFGDVVGKRDVVIGGEAPNLVGMIAQAIDQVECLALSSASALAGRRCARIGCLASGKNGVVILTVESRSFVTVRGTASSLKAL